MSSGDRTVRTIRVAAVQMGSQEGAIAANLAHASPLVEEAARAGAKLVLLPELMPTGYLWSRQIWGAAEPEEGPTVRWLRRTSGELGIWLGTSYLESDGKDFFNTFVLTTPEGQEAGRVRKQFPSIGEAFIFKGEPGSHVISTALAKIGVAICFDGHIAQVARLMSEQGVDLILIPHSYSIPAQPAGSVSRTDLERMKGNLRDIAPIYSRLLGILAVSTNKCGPARAPRPEGYLFPGLATISNSDGTIRARMDDQEGYIAADITLDPGRKTRARPHAYGRYVYPGPPGRALFGAVEYVGRLWYAINRERRSRAREALSLSMGQAS
jgi:N-carbamoylputrescine amidase